jgi:hypothetical protein
MHVFSFSTACGSSQYYVDAHGSAEGDSPLPEGEVSSLLLPFSPPKAAKKRKCNSPARMNMGVVKHAIF